MRLNTILLSITLTLGVSGVTVSQQTSQQPTPSPKPEVYLAPNAPKDKPVDAKGAEAEQLEEAIKPYIEKAKNTYPQAKARFLTGLPPKHTFFITTRLHDSLNRYEQVFIAVRQIKDGRVTGVIASNVHLVSGFSEGDIYKFSESELVDWTISKPDGTEEGNFVGNFIDTYQVTHSTAGGVWKNQPVTPAGMNRRIEDAAVQYAVHAPIPRIVLYDVGFPMDETEATALDGNAVILLTAVSQTREELPLQRVYVLSEGKEVELKSLKVVLAELNTPGAASAKTFGKFRADGLYLLPLSLRVKNVDLLVDFRTNRIAFKVATFTGPLPDDLKGIAAVKPSGAGPSQTALQTFIKREYPTFVDQ